MHALQLEPFVGVFRPRAHFGWCLLVLALLAPISAGAAPEAPRAYQAAAARRPVPAEFLIFPRCAVTRTIRTEPNSTRTNVLITYQVKSPDPTLASLRACFDLNDRAQACNPLDSQCCATGAATTPSVRQVQFFPATACATPGQTLARSYANLKWAINGAAVQPKYDAPGGAILLDRTWRGSATLCVDIPNTARCSNLGQLCGPVGCRLTTVTTTFTQVGSRRGPCKVNHVVTVCEFGCLNNATCVATNQCDCTGTGYLGPTCATIACTPSTCPAQAQCGFASDGCGGSTGSCGACTTPLFCEAAHLTCRCPDGQQLVGGTCLTVTGGNCTAGAQCVSGICSQGVCVNACPGGSSPFQGNCRCLQTFFGPNGTAPCLACGGGSTSKTKGATACVCPSPANWDASTNACQCPGTDAFVAGQCLKIPGGACTAGEQCVSGECSSPTNGTCVEQCPPNSSDGTPVGGASGLCVCDKGFYSSTGFSTCFACGAGSNNTAFGSKSCACSSPTNSVWQAGNNTCLCPPDRTLSATTCLLKPGGACRAGTDCASPGLCSSGVCVSSCPTGSVPASGGCACSAGANYFSATGTAPCRRCGGGSVANGAGTTCTCVAPAVYNATSNVCQCPSSGQTYANGTCLINLGGPCSNDTICLTKTCSAGVCTSTCPAGSSDIPPLGCLCNPNHFNLATGQPTCTACVSGSHSDGYGSTACVCTVPAGSDWQQNNTCACPVNQAESSGVCRGVTGEPCATGDQCVSGLCSSGACVTQCPPNSTSSGGACVCVPGFFNTANGQAPCTQCGAGATSSAQGATACTCSAAATSWNPSSNSCECTEAGRAYDAASNSCKLMNKQSCTLGAACLSGTCSSAVGGICVPKCPENSQRDALGDCICNRGFYSKTTGAPPCYACPANATSSVGSTACNCPSDAAGTRLVWQPTTGTCTCPSNRVSVGGLCKLINFETCTAGAQCASGICAVDSGSTGAPLSQCLPSCPAPNTTVTLSGGTCLCSAATSKSPGYFGPGGRTPCTMCGAGSVASTAGSSACTCPTNSTAVWSAATNACVCQPGQTFVESRCLKNNNQPCTQSSECLSGRCSAPTGGVCVDTCPLGSSSLGNTCLCDAGYFSATGAPAPNCTPCPAGSSSDRGATECTCFAPTGSAWVAATASCQCPSGTVLSGGGTCLLDIGRPCPGGAAACNSGICAATTPQGGPQCVGACPPGSEDDGAAGCICSTGFFSPSGASPCTQCPAGATTASTGASQCECQAIAGQVWDPNTNACVCPVGQMVSSTNTCLLTDGQTCVAGAECASGTCSNANGGVCTSSCSVFPNASPNTATSTCVCSPQFFSADGAPPNCTRCATGAGTSSFGSTQCTCSAPTGSTWNAASNTCQCPTNTTAVNGACLKNNGQRCEGGRECASALCDHGKCATSCSSGAPDGSGGCGCVAGETRCAAAAGGGCYNLKTSNTNCGRCFNPCPALSNCENGVCVCRDDRLPVYAPSSAQICTTVSASGIGSATRTYSVTPGTYTLWFNAFNVPDRFVVRVVTPCGTKVYDTGFRGNAGKGCAASAPCCCRERDGSGCGFSNCGRGNGPVCRDGGGQGTTPTFVVPPSGGPLTDVFVTGYGVCSDTKYEYRLRGPGCA